MMRYLIIAYIILLGLATQAKAQGLLCAEVKIEIEQELTLERQAFEARMRIINGLPQSLTNISVQLQFFDTDGNVVLASTDPNDPNPDVRFFFSENAPGVPDSISSNDENRSTWLIIPTAEAGGQQPSGVLYDIGATLTYTIGASGVEETVVVSPDRITVMPLPQLALDYFLPFDVIGDDPTTELNVEPAEPFSLGVRVKNIGFGTAVDVKIDSAQPRIVDNELGLLIAFSITGTEVNETVVPNSLLVDFGDIPPITEGYAAMGRWIMESTLAGRFTSFDATVSHADELGGELTALITNENLNTHTLIRRVLADISGRDERKDFLASERNDPTFITLYESNGNDTSVFNETEGAGSSLTPSGDNWSFSLSGDAGFSYVRFVDPFGGAQDLLEVRRSDGKRLLAENAWLDRTWNADADSWDYWLHVLDADNVFARDYTVEFTAKPDINQPPVFQLILDRRTEPGTQVGFIVLASDQNNDAITLEAAGLPLNALFTESVRNPGQAINFFNWTPASDQTGTYAIEFTARDTNGLEASQVVHIFVTSNDTVGGYDSYIARYFGDITDPAIIGIDADPDFDGMMNLAEYGQNTHPLEPDRELGPVIGITEVGEQSFVNISFRRRLDDASLNFTVEGFDSVGTLRTEQSTIVDATTDGIPDGLEWVTIRDSVPLSAANPQRFLELRVTQ